MSEDHVKSQGSFAVGQAAFGPSAFIAVQGEGLAGAVGSHARRAEPQLDMRILEAIGRQREVKELAKSLLPSFVHAADSSGAAKLAFDFAEAFMVEAEARAARVTS